MKTNKRIKSGEGEAHTHSEFHRDSVLDAVGRLGCILFCSCCCCCLECSFYCGHIRLIDLEPHCTAPLYKRLAQSCSLGDLLTASVVSANKERLNAVEQRQDLQQGQIEDLLQQDMNRVWNVGSKDGHRYIAQED